MSEDFADGKGAPARKPGDRAGGDRAPDDLGGEVGVVTRAQELDDPDRHANPVDRAINRVAEVLGVAILATVVGLVFANAVARYAFKASFIWGDELVLNLVPWLAMSGMFLSIRRRQVIRIDFFVTKLPAPLQRAVNVFAQIVAVAVFAYIAFAAFSYVQLFGSDLTLYLRLPQGWFTSAMVIGTAAAALALLMDIVRTLRGRS